MATLGMVKCDVVVAWLETSHVRLSGMLYSPAPRPPVSSHLLGAVAHSRLQARLHLTLSIQIPLSPLSVSWLSDNESSHLLANGVCFIVIFNAWQSSNCTAALSPLLAA